MRARGEHCAVRPSPVREPDVVIGTDAATWLGLREGRLSGLDAFAQRRLYARGNLDLALGFEGLFRLPGDRPPLLRVTEVETPGATISSLISGQGPEQVICLHGLGSNKTSFFETIAALTPDHTVHAIDLPGFGSSSKPARGAYNAPYFARSVLGYMDAMAIERAHLVGNSMGGRVAIELALTEPDRAETLSLLAPALAFRRRRELVPLVKLLRPELAAIPHPLGPARVREQFWSLFARPERLDPAAADIAADEFCRTYRSRSARIAFFAAARNIYLDAPARRARALDPARRPAHARPVHLGRPRPPRPGRLLPPRGRGAPARPPGRADRVRPRSPGRAARAHQRADPRADRVRPRLAGSADPRSGSEPPPPRRRSAGAAPPARGALSRSA